MLFRFAHFHLLIRDIGNVITDFGLRNPIVALSWQGLEQALFCTTSSLMTGYGQSRQNML